MSESAKKGFSLQWLVPLGNTLGFLLLLAGVGLPLLREKHWHPQVREKVKATAEEIAAYEEDAIHIRRGNAVLFPPGALPADLVQWLERKNVPTANSGFAFETFVDGQGVLVVRATPGEGQLTNAAIPLEIYEYRLKVGDKQRSDQWIKP